MKTVRVFDTIRDEVDGKTPFEECTGLLEFNNVSNDSYHDWTVDNPEKGKYYVDPNYLLDGTYTPDGNTEKKYMGGSGGGYLTEKEEEAIDTWLKALGATSGEEVLIYHWW